MPENKDEWTVFTLPIGDWSDDGHGKCVEYPYAVNKTKEEIIKAYHDSSKLLNMTFDTNDWGDGKAQLLCDYQDDKLSANIVKKLLENGFSFKYFDDFWEDDIDRNIYVSHDEVPYLFFEFAKISLPDLEYKYVPEQKNYLIGHNSELSFHLGYGVFE